MPLRVAVFGGLAILYLVLPSCDLLTVSDRAEEVQVLVESPDPVDSALVITSTQFLIGFTDGGAEEVLFTAPDTLVANLPFDRTFAMSPTGMFVVRALMIEDPPEEEDDEERATLSLRVLVDGDEVFNASQEMEAETYLQYYVIDR